jgi:HSP20 family molecular chaperone IbpA
MSGIQCLQGAGEKRRSEWVPRRIEGDEGRLSKGLSRMNRLSVLSNPLLLGFEEIERLIDRTGKGGNEGYPPYNIERIGGTDGAKEKLRITIALAGFTRDQLEILVEDNQLIVRGRQQDDKTRDYLYRGIATRQ